MSKFSCRRSASVIALLTAIVVLAVAAPLGAAVSRISSVSSGRDFSSHISTSGSQFAGSLFTRILIPTGTQRVGKLSQPIKQAVAPIVPSDRRNLIDVAQEFLVPKSVNLSQYLNHHQQPTRVLSTGIVEPEGLRGKYHYNYLLWCPNRHVAYCDVTYSVVPVGGGVQELRIDVQVLWVPIQPVLMPTSGSVTLTGFKTISELGQPVKSVSVVLTGSQAAKLHQVIASLKPTIDGFFCSLDTTVFRISVAVRQGGPVTWHASADQCPGILYIYTSGKTMMLDDHRCSLHQVVASLLPSIGAKGSRAALKQCLN